MAFEHPNEDLFEDTKMSFGEHLEELRVVLVRALIGLVVGFLIALFIANDVVEFLQKPLKDAIAKFTIDKAVEDLKAENDGIVPPELGPRLSRDRLAPKRFQVNPNDMISVIAPYLADNAVMQTLIEKPYSIRPFQIKTGQTVTLAVAMEEAGRDEDGTDTKRLWELLSESQLGDLSVIAAKDSASADDRQTVLRILNELAESDELYPSTEFDWIFEGEPQQGGLVGLYRKWFPEDPPKLSALQRFRGDLLAAEEGEADPDLRRRLNNWVISIVLSDYMNEPVIELQEIQFWETTDINTQALNAHEVFMIYLKAALITGLLISSPWVFYQLWIFVAAGLYPHERKYVYIYLPFSIGLFFGGAALAFFFVFEPVLAFLFSFNASMGIDPQPRIGEWLSFVMFLPIGFGVAFQLPLVMLFLHRIGLVSIKMYLEKWRLAVLIIFVLSMILTPADPISMIMLAFPLTILYFGGIGLCRWMPRGRNPFSEAYEPS